MSTIPEWSEDSSVLILGEKHGNPESQKLTVALKIQSIGERRFFLDWKFLELSRLRQDFSDRMNKIYMIFIYPVDPVDPVKKKVLYYQVIKMT